jgi:hypothetical protein
MRVDLSAALGVDPELPDESAGVDEEVIGEMVSVAEEQSATVAL